MLIPDLLNILFDQCDYDTLIKLCLLHKRKTAYAKKYSVLISYDVLSEHTAYTKSVCVEGKMKIIKLINGAFFECPDDQFMAAHIKYFTDRGSKKCMNPQRMSDAVELCAENGYLELVKYFANKISNINPNPALCKAAIHGHLPVIKYLVSVPTTVWVDINMALVDSAGYGYLESVIFLIGIGACVDAEYGIEYGIEPMSTDRCSALSSAARYGHLQVVEYLINAGADIHSCNNYALRLAVTYGRLNVVKCLVEAGCVLDQKKHTEFRIAAKRGHVKIMKYFVSIGANVDECIGLIRKPNISEAVANYLIELYQL